MKLYNLFYVVDDIPDEGWGTEGSADYCGSFTSKDKIKEFLLSELGKEHYDFTTESSNSSLDELLGSDDDPSYFEIVESKLDKPTDENIIGWWYVE